MEVNNLLIVTCILATVVAVNGQNTPSLSPAAPGGDCTTLIYNMADCITFLSAGSNETTPDETCCSGLKLVLDTDAECLCEALKNSADMGLEINMTKAVTLPSACAIKSAPSISSCNASIAPATPPGATPANPPSPSSPPSESPVVPVSPPTPNSPAPSTTADGAPVSQAPAPAPSGAYIISISIPYFFIMVLASFFYMSY